MNVKETDFPEKFRPIIRRLQGAIQEKDVRDIMIVEDDFLLELNDYENRIAEERKQKVVLAKYNRPNNLLLKLDKSTAEIATHLNLP